MLDAEHREEFELHSRQSEVQGGILIRMGCSIQAAECGRLR